MNRPSTVSPAEYDLAKTLLTQAELDVWKLTKSGYSQRRITRNLNISRTTVRDRLENARRKLDHAQRTETR